MSNFTPESLGRCQFKPRILSRIPIQEEGRGTYVGPGIALSLTPESLAGYQFNPRIPINRSLPPPTPYILVIESSDLQLHCILLTVQDIDLTTYNTTVIRLSPYNVYVYYD